MYLWWMTLTTFLPGSFNEALDSSGTGKITRFQIKHFSRFCTFPVGQSTVLSPHSFRTERKVTYGYLTWIKLDEDWAHKFITNLFLHLKNKCGCILCPRCMHYALILTVLSVCLCDQLFVCFLIQAKICSNKGSVTGCGSSPFLAYSDRNLPLLHCVRTHLIRDVASFRGVFPWPGPAGQHHLPLFISSRCDSPFSSSFCFFCFVALRCCLTGPGRLTAVAGLREERLLKSGMTDDRSIKPLSLVVIQPPPKGVAGDSSVRVNHNKSSQFRKHTS